MIKLQPIPQTTSIQFDGLAITYAQPVFEDSFFVPGFVKRALKLDPQTVFDMIQIGAPWTNVDDPNFMYRGNELRRKKAFLNSVDGGKIDRIVDMHAPPSLLARYSYPGFQHASMEHYRPFQRVPVIHTMALELQKKLVVSNKKKNSKVSFNHVIATCYRDEEDNIGYHNDKVKDIKPNTPIVSLSFGETREFHFGRPDPNDKKKTIFERAFVLQSGDMFILGPITNQLHRHAIVPVSQERVLQRKQKALNVGPRISLVLRDIATIISLETARKKAKVTERERTNRALKKAKLEIKNGRQEKRKRYQN
jgi:alkylated DNA repair dioxygenase AlkB